MGNHIQVQGCSTASSSAHSTYQFLRECRHGKLMRQLPTNKTIIAHQFLTTDDLTHTQMLTRLRLEKPHTNLTNLLKFQTQQRGGFCTSGSRILALFEYSQMDLQMQLTTRSRQRVSFHQQDIINILTLLVDAVLQLRILNARVRITPRNVLILQDKSMRLVNPLLEEGMVTVEGYHAPESTNPNQIRSYEKEMVFEVGMTMLSVMSLRNAVMCYKDGELQLEQLTRLIGRCEKAYSQRVMGVLKGMLMVDQVGRMALEELGQRVRELVEEEEQENLITVSQLENVSNLKTITVADNISITPEFFDRLRLEQEISRPKMASGIRKSQPIYSSNHHNHHNQQNLPPPPSQPNLSHDLPSKTQSSLALPSSPLNPNLKSTVFQRSSAGSAFRTVSSNNINSAKSSASLSRSETREKLPSGAVYVGGKQFGMMNGHGKLVYPNGTYYQGNFMDDNIEGFGILYLKAGTPLYQGFWKSNQYDGQGILYNTKPQQLNKSFDYRDFSTLSRSWLYYRGSFVNHNRHGKGLLFLSNGEYFTGQFNNNEIDGQGEFHMLKGVMVSGHWKRNKMIQ